MRNERSSRRVFLTRTGFGMAGAILGLAGKGTAAELTRFRPEKIGFPGAAKQGPVETQGAAASSQYPSAFDVRACGAAGDGSTLDSVAVNRAIELAAAAGGGLVRFPAGRYLCFSIRLKSNVALYLEPGATIIAADPPASEGGTGYDLAEPNQWDMYQDYGHSHWRNSLIWGEDLENVSILGPGLIWGKGLSKGYGPGPVAEKPGAGNKVIALKNCHGIILRDFSILHGGHFGILATGVDNFTIDNLKIDTNRDGMDVDCCRNVRISNCSVNSPWDDAICLKSSFGLGYARPTEMVTVTNCFVTGGYEEGTLLNATYHRLSPGAHLFRTGRIKCGTESNGGFRDITISNCVFEDCHGLALETVDGGLLEDITVSNLTMRDIASAPIFLRLGSRMRGPQGIPVGKLRRVSISNVVVSNAARDSASIISGIPGHYIEDVRLNDICVESQGHGTEDDALMVPPEKESGYPEPTMFGTMPAHGFYLRHARGIEMSNVEVTCIERDLRPAFYLDDVQEAGFLNIKAPRARDVPTFVLKDVENFGVYQSAPIPDTEIVHVRARRL
jgi:polygalacturonase